MPELSLAFLLSAFVGGFVMFLAPCTLPIVPAFIASMMPDAVSKNPRREIIIRTIAFTIGFACVFVLLGILSGFLGAALSVYKQTLTQIGAVFIIIFGFALLGLFEIPFLKQSFQRLRVPSMKKGRVFRPALLGVVFALGWSPCAGPVLASILLLASQTGTAVQGGLLLGLFSLGLAIPFILVGALYAHLLGFFDLYTKYHRTISVISGVFLIFLGGSLLFTESLMFSTFGFAMYDFFGIAPMCTYY